MWESVLRPLENLPLTTDAALANLHAEMEWSSIQVLISIGFLNPPKRLERIEQDDVCRTVNTESSI